MKKRRVFLSTMLCVVILLSLVGCSAGKNGSKDSSSESPKPSPAQVQRVSMGTAGSGGAYFVMGAAMANLINNTLDNIEMNAEITDGSLQNINFIASGEMDIGLSGIQTAINAYEGKGDFKTKMDIRAMALMHPSVIQIVASEYSGVNKMEDMKGKRVAVGAPGSGARPNFEAILEFYGMSFNDFKVYDLSYVEAVDAMKDRNLDVFWAQAGLPTTSVLDIANSENIVLVPVSEDLCDKINNKYSHLIKATIPKGMYNNKEDIPTMAVPNIMLCAADADEEVIYQITKCIFNNLDELAKSHEAFKLISIESGPTNAIPMHPGAERYFKEMGAM